MAPASALSAPERTRISVLFPAPFSPTRATISPASTENDTPFNATVAPKDFRMSRMVSIAAGDGAGVEDRVSLS